MATERQLWELNRSTPPSSRKFNGTALELWERACEYFQFCDKNPYWMTVQKNGKKSKSEGMVLDDLYIPTESDDTLDLPVKRMYTKQGFCIRLGVPKAFFNNYEKYYPDDDNMLTCIEVISDIIEEHQLTNAAGGFYKEALVSKINALTEKLAVDNNIKKIDIFKIGDQEISFE